MNNQELLNRDAIHKVFSKREGQDEFSPEEIEGIKNIERLTWSEVAKTLQKIEANKNSKNESIINAIYKKVLSVLNLRKKSIEELKVEEVLKTKICSLVEIYGEENDGQFLKTG